MRVAHVAVVLLAACGSSSQGPYFQDERYLRFGIDTDEEQEKLEEQFAQAGKLAAVKLRGKHFSALGFVDADDNPVAVRVLTSRGVGLHLDSVPAGPLTERLSVSLEPPPLENEHDADGDGFEEVFVRVRDGHFPEGCIHVYRVRDVGFVDPVVLGAGPVGDWVCVDGVRDLDGDGQVELLANISWLAMGVTPAPRVRVGFESMGHSYVPRAPDAGLLAAYLDSEIQRRGALDPAQQSSQQRLLTAVEVAMLHKLAGLADAERLEAYDKAVAGLDLSQDLLARVRAWVQL